MAPAEPLEGVTEMDADDFPGGPEDDPVTDADLPYVALFAGVPEDEVEAHAAALREVLAPPAEPTTKAKAKA